MSVLSMFPPLITTFILVYNFIHLFISTITSVLIPLLCLSQSPHRLSFTTPQNQFKRESIFPFATFEYIFSFLACAANIYTSYKFYRLRPKLKKDVDKQDAIWSDSMRLQLIKCVFLCSELGGLFLKGGHVQDARAVMLKADATQVAH